MKRDRSGAGKSVPNGALLAVGIAFLIMGLTMDNMAAFIGVGVVFMALGAGQGKRADDGESSDAQRSDE